MPSMRDRPLGQHVAQKTLPPALGWFEKTRTGQQVTEVNVYRDLIVSPTL